MFTDFQTIAGKVIMETLLSLCIIMGRKILLNIYMYTHMHKQFDAQLECCMVLCYAVNRDTTRTLV